MNESKTETQPGGPLLVLLGGTAWGLLGLFLRHLGAGGLGTLEVCVLRAAGTALLMLVALALFHRQSLKIHAKDWWCFAGCGCVSILLFNYCYFLTLQRTSMGIAVILLYTSPIFVSLMSWALFGEAFTRRKTLALVMMIGGCALVSGVFSRGQHLTATGLLTGLGSGLSYALYSIFGRCAQKRGYSSVTITAWSFFFAGGGSWFLVNWKTIGQAFAAHPGLWGWEAALVVISTILPYCLYTAGLARMEASRAAVLVAIEPVVATLTGIVAYHERLSLPAIAGIVLVLAAILVLQRRGTRPPLQHAPRASHAGA